MTSREASSGYPVSIYYLTEAFTCRDKGHLETEFRPIFFLWLSLLLTNVPQSSAYFRMGKKWGRKRLFPPPYLCLINNAEGGTH